MLLLHLSDPHFGTEQAPVVDALLRLAREHRPELAVLSGDVTQRARTAQFRAARDFVDRLGVRPTLVLPGNHDIPLYNVAARAFSPYAGYLRSFGPDLEPVVDTPRWLVIGVNTTRPRRHKDGEVSADQVERVAARLAQAREGQLRLVVVHQPVAVTDPHDLENLLHGRAGALARWSQAGADLVLGGHIHLPYVLPLHDRMPGLARRVWAVQAGTALSSRVRDGVPNSVNLIRWHDGACTVERWDYSAAARGFDRAAVTALELGADR